MKPTAVHSNAPGLHITHHSLPYPEQFSVLHDPFMASSTSRYNIAYLLDPIPMELFLCLDILGHPNAYHFVTAAYSTVPICTGL